MKARLHLLLFGALLALPFPARAIEGGTPPSAAVARTTVALQFQMGRPDEWWHHCTGVLWDDELVLTAAHCIPDLESRRPFRVAFTTDESAQGYETRPVTGYLRQEGFVEADLHEQEDHDLGLVRFSGGIPAGFVKAKLLSAQDAAGLSPGAAILIAGFGAPSYDRYEMGALKQTVLKLANSRHGPTELRLDQSENGGACSGDSGGPAFLVRDGTLMLWGIASRSWPLRVKDCRHSILYTRLDTQLDWLAKAAAELRAEPELGDPWVIR